jgi:hypothetical protein
LDGDLFCIPILKQISSVSGSLLFTINYECVCARFIPLSAKALNLNTRTRVAFDLNLGTLEQQIESLLAGTGIGYAGGLDVASTPDFWTHLVVLCYQPGTDDDGDPDFFPNAAVSQNVECGFINPLPECRPLDKSDEGFLFGATPDLSTHPTAIVVETIRDLNVGGPVLGEQFTDLEHTVAHEVGHGPGDQDEAADHSEEGLMTSGAPKVIGNNPNNRFTPASINRYRSDRTW